jgi:hypothetical protein
MDNPWLLFFGSILLFFGIRFVSSKSKYKISQQVSNVFLVVHLTLTVIFILMIFLAFKGYSLRGFRSTSWIFLIMTFFGILFFVLRPHSINMRPVLFFSYLWTTFCVGFSSWLICYILWNYKEDLVYSGKKYRLERTGWFITPCKLPTLFVRDGVFEKRFDYTTNEHCLAKKDIDSVKIVQSVNDTLIITFYHHSSWKDMPKPIVTKAYEP